MLASPVIVKDGQKGAHAPSPQTLHTYPRPVAFCDSGGFQSVASFPCVETISNARGRSTREFSDQKSL